MDEDVKILINKFKLISKRGWIKSNSKNWGSVGLTFENLLNKKVDSMFFPDYLGIEIKCTTLHSTYPLFLFTICFDGPTFPEINRLIEKFGYYDKDYPNKKILYKTINDTKKLTNHKYQFQFEIDYKKDKLLLCVYDKYQNLIEKESFVYLSSIKNHLLIKLNKLALIYSATKKVNKEQFFHYYKMEIYKLKNFDIFLKLLMEGIIKVDLIARISGSDKGRYRNKNLVFKIPKDKIWRLFDRIYSYSSQI